MMFILKTAPKIIRDNTRNILKIGMPLYIPIISLLISFILVYKKNKKNILFNRYLFFSLSFVLLVISNLLVRYSGSLIYILLVIL